MITEKELKEEIEEDERLRDELVDEYYELFKGGVNVKEAINNIINKRNAEVKQVIINWVNEEKQLGNRGWKNLILRTKRELLQKLGLDAKEGGGESE